MVQWLCHHQLKATDQVQLLQGSQQVFLIGSSSVVTTLDLVVEVHIPALTSREGCQGVVTDLTGIDHRGLVGLLMLLDVRNIGRFGHRY
ncbi:hypothetical protein D3C81_1665520 [compost metagenome]